MSWNLPFGEPIELAKGNALRTLRDAANHIIALPARESAKDHWQTAMACLLSAAEKNGLVMLARIAVVQALRAAKPVSPQTPGNAKKYKIVS
jgi:hypothetical protein